MLVTQAPSRAVPRIPSASGNAGVSSDFSIATMQSRGFQVDFANRHGLVPRLFPWRYDEAKQQWKSEIWPIRKGQPSEEEIFEANSQTTRDVA